MGNKSQALMDESRDQLVPFGMVLQALRKRCNAADSGNMYLITDKNHGGVFSLVQGRIVDVSYHSVRGAEALPLMREIEATKFFFKQNTSIPKADAGKTTSLPDNDVIFKSFGLGASSGTSEVKGKAKRILVVEDSGLARKALVNVLASKGYETVEAADGFEALGKLSKHNIDLVLLDLILPKMDGYAVLSAMKKDDANRNIPVIVLTSRDALFDKLKGKMSGTDEYLTKPIKPNEVMDKVGKYLD